MPSRIEDEAADFLSQFRASAPLAPGDPGDGLPYPNRTQAEEQAIREAHRKAGNHPRTGGRNRASYPLWRSLLVWSGVRLRREDWGPPHLDKHGMTYRQVVEQCPEWLDPDDMADG